MSKLHLLKSTDKKQDIPQRGRGSAVSSERRYRYPSDEIWQVSEERWQVAESHHLPKVQPASPKPA
jgi:hypothetical protein